MDGGLTVTTPGFGALQIERNPNVIQSGRSITVGIRPPEQLEIAASEPEGYDGTVAGEVADVASTVRTCTTTSGSKVSNGPLPPRFRTISTLWITAPPAARSGWACRPRRSSTWARMKTRTKTQGEDYEDLSFLGGSLSTALVGGVAVADGADLTVFDWSGYEDQGFFADYMAKHGAAPSYTFFGSQEEAFTKLQSGFTADLAHPPCSDAVRKWVAADLLVPLDPSKLDNWDALLPEIKEVDGIVIDGQVWMMPFEWGQHR